jgi:putative acetyltransferase
VERPAGLGAKNMIRKFADTDTEIVAGLWRRTWIATNPHISFSEPIQHWKQRLLSEISKNREIILYEHDSIVAAFLVLDSSTAYLSQLFVDIPFQRKGIGKKMLDHVSDRFPLGWSLNVISDNKSAIAVYERYGLTRGEVSVSPITFRERVEYYCKKAR